MTCLSLTTESWKMCPPPKFTLKYSKSRRTLSFPCADGSLKLEYLPRPHIGEKPAEGHLVLDGEETEDNNKLRMCGDFRNRQHEVHRSKIVRAKRRNMLV